VQSLFRTSLHIFLLLNVRSIYSLLPGYRVVSFIPNTEYVFFSISDFDCLVSLRPSCKRVSYNFALFWMIVLGLYTFGCVIVE